ncbi:MAG: GNAT family N-acetyltransferase [Dehalococcoidia bacterium]|jgi:ribosomal protein S18 acetylase RimI-like enzyme
MDADAGIVRLESEQVEDAGKMLGRAFFDNPMSLFLLPVAAARARPLTWMFDRTARYGLLFGEVYTTAAAVDGAAIWLSPDSPPMTRETLTAAGMMEMPQAMGSEPFQRLMLMKRHFDELRLRDAPERHWYLWTLGVDPPRQGQGVGSALLRPVLSLAHREGLPCYLEADKAKNVPFYQRHGFEVVEEDDLPGGGMHYWTMKRPAKR